MYSVRSLLFWRKGCCRGGELIRPLIGTTPVHADKAILLRASEEDMRRNAKARSQNTSREIDLRRTLHIGRLIESCVYDFVDKRDVIEYNMSYE